MRTKFDIYVYISMFCESKSNFIYTIITYFNFILNRIQGNKKFTTTKNSLRHLFRFYAYHYWLDDQHGIAAVVVVIDYQLDLQLPMQSVPITTTWYEFESRSGEMYSIQHYMIKIVSHLR